MLAEAALADIVLNISFPPVASMLTDLLLFHPSQPKPMHLHRQLKQIIQTLTLRLRLRDILAPHVDTMSPHQHRARFGKLFDRSFQRLPQIFFVRRILNDRYAQRIVET